MESSIQTISKDSLEEKIKERRRLYFLLVRFKESEKYSAEKKALLLKLESLDKEILNNQSSIVYILNEF